QRAPRRCRTNGRHGGTFPGPRPQPRTATRASDSSTRRDRRDAARAAARGRHPARRPSSPARVHRTNSRRVQTRARCLSPARARRCRRDPHRTPLLCRSSLLRRSSRTKVIGGQYRSLVYQPLRRPPAWRDTGHSGTFHPRMRLRRIYALLFALIAMLLGVAVTETDARGFRAAEMAVSGQVERAAPVARGGTFTGPAPLDTLHPVHRAARYVATADPVRPSETASIPVTIRNLSDATWETNGAHPVRLSYHLYDAAGSLVSWDGPRSPLSEDVAPGGETTVLMSLVAPRYTGNFVVRPDLIRDGVAWFSHEEAPAGSFPLRVTTDLDAGYGESTAPATIIPGGEVPVEIVLANTGLATWHASGPNPIHVSYHWFDGSTPVIWDGAR